MMIRCESCAARYTLPDDQVGDRGAKLRCSCCGAKMVVFPSKNTVMSLDAEPTTEDIRPIGLLGEPPVEQLMPAGTVPPVKRVRAAGPHDALSVTPPPPRAIRRPVVTHLRSQPRARTPAPVASERLTHGGAPQRRSVRPAPQAGAHTYGGSHTAPTAPSTDRVSAAGFAPSDPGSPTYAPPWGVSPQATPIPPYWQAAPHIPYAPTGTPAPQSYAGPAVTHPGAPHAGIPPWTHPGLERHPSAPGAPLMSYAPPWGTHTTATGAPPAVVQWRPQWVPAVVLGMERTTLVMLLTVVLLVGFVGACMGVGTGRLLGGAAGPEYPSRVQLDPQPKAPFVVVPRGENRAYGSPILPMPRPATATPFRVEPADP